MKNQSFQIQESVISDTEQLVLLHISGFIIKNIEENKQKNFTSENISHLVKNNSEKNFCD